MANFIVNLNPSKTQGQAALYAEEFVRWAPEVMKPAGYMLRLHEEAMGLAAYTKLGRFVEKIVIV